MCWTFQDAVCTFLFQVVPPFAMPSCHLLLGCPHDLFLFLGCHSVQRLVHLSSFILAICLAHFQLCFSVYCIMSIIFVLFLISEHGTLSYSFECAYLHWYNDMAFTAICMAFITILRFSSIKAISFLV